MLHMFRKGTKRVGLGLVGAILAGLPLLVACGGKQPEAQQVSQKVQVNLSDKSIEMPPSLPAGLTTFTVTNTGRHDHSFGITGPTGDKMLEKALKPGESGSLELHLDNGTYRIYCPIDQDRGEGTQIALDVRSAPQGSKG